MSAYADFAYVYDELMADVPYGAWIGLYEQIWEKYGARPKLLLDVGCGTGTMLRALAESGMELIGCDPSEDMLQVTAEKTADCEPRPLLVCQSMESLDLYGTVDGAISALDCVNYIEDTEALRRSFARLALFLEPGALFIFDVNTPEKLCGLDGRCIVKETEEVFCVWQNDYLPAERRCRFTLDTFVRAGKGWERFCEEQYESAFTDAELTEAAELAGMDILERIAPTDHMPEGREERVFYVARKRLV